jgi:hypothetical protein
LPMNLSHRCRRGHRPKRNRRGSRCEGE